MGASISQSELLDRLCRQIDEAPDDRCPCTLVIGSGFSYPIVPTTSQIVREELPWFIWCQRQEVDGPSKQDFDNSQSRTNFAERASDHAKIFWSKIHRWAAQHVQPGGHKLTFTMGGDGLPDRADIANAYMAAFSPACPHGLCTDECARRFLGELIKRSGKRLNPAHLYLASILGEKTRPFRTIFTTNFDPLLQRALQLVNVPYFVSDRPDTMQHPDDDGVLDALHLVHVHGSIYRYLLLNTPEEINGYAERNQTLLQEYFRKHAVLIVGYGGWDDAITRALDRVDRFGHNLYWCDRGENPQNSGLSPKAQKILSRHHNAFYVPINGANELLVSLHHRLVGHSLPRLFRDPIAVVSDQFDQCDLTGIRVSKVGDAEESDQPVVDQALIDDSKVETSRKSSASDDLDLGVQVESMRARLRGAELVMRGEPQELQQARLRTLMTTADDLYFGPHPDRTLPILDLLLNEPGLREEERAKLLYRRGVTNSEIGRSTEAIADYTALIDMPSAPAEHMAKALLNRGVAHGKAGRHAEEIADYTALIELPGTSLEQMTKALFNRAFAHGVIKRSKEEIADYTALIDMPAAPVALVAKALCNRGVAHSKAGHSTEEVADYTTLIGLPGASAEQVATALLNRAIAYGESGRSVEAIVDYTTLIGMPNASAEKVTQALHNRGILNRKIGLHGEEIADYTAAINTPSAPVEYITRALLNRGVAHGNAGRNTEEIADYTAVIDMPGAPVDQVAKALFNRGVAHGRVGKKTEEIADYTALINLPGAPTDLAERAKKMIAQRARVTDEN